MSSLIFCHHCGEVNLPDQAICVSCGQSLLSISMTPTGMLPASTFLHNRYLIVEQLGKGGMGAVYKAEDTLLGNRLVAIKEMSQQKLPPSKLPKAIENFKQEAILLARLQHPSLPSIHDYFEEEGRWYLVMSYVQGESLREYLEQNGNLPLDEVFHIGIELCLVLDYLHSQQPPIIFRDLKPSNIMRNVDGQIFLVDFGIARHFKPGQTRDTVSLGSMGYAAPEQYAPEQTTPRTDIYSLGVLVHQMLTGYNPSLAPFHLPDLADFDVQVPVELNTLLLRMLDPTPEKRPKNIDEVLIELQRISMGLVASTDDDETAMLDLHDQVTEPTPEELAATNEADVSKQPQSNVSIPRRTWLVFVQGGAILSFILALSMDIMTYPTWFTYAVGDFMIAVSATTILDILLVSLALFAGITLGPLAGFLVGLAAVPGGLFGVLHNHFAWHWDVRVALIGLVVSLLVRQARRRHSQLSLTQMNGQTVLAILIGTAFASYLDMWQQGYSFITASSEFVGISVGSVIGCIVLLSICLPLYQKAVKLRKS